MSNLVQLARVTPDFPFAAVIFNRRPPIVVSALILSLRSNTLDNDVRDMTLGWFSLKRERGLNISLLITANVEGVRLALLYTYTRTMCMKTTMKSPVADVTSVALRRWSTGCANIRGSSSSEL